MDLFGNRRKRTTDKPSTAYVDEVITYLYNTDDRITTELLDKQNNGTTDQTTTYAWSGTRQSSKTVVIPSTSTVTQTFSYTLPGMLSRVVTENKNGSNVVTSRTRVDYDYTSTGIRSLSVDWNDANLNNSFATSERTGSVEYLVDSTNHTGYAQTIVETTKNAAGVATKRIVYTHGSDEISQTTYLPPAGGGVGWNVGTTLTFSHDAHTSVRMLTDAAGAIAQVFTYAAYGELIAIHNRIAQSVGTVGAQGLQSQALTSLLYNGEAFDSRIGQHYLRARWYDLHRFTTLDPFAGRASDPLSFNKYGFVHGDPIQGTDPTGMFNMVSTLGSMSIAGFKMGLTSLAVGAVLRGAYAGYALYNGQPVSEVLKDLFWGLAQDFVMGALLGGAGNVAARILASNALKVRLLGQSISQFRWMRLPGSAWLLDRFARGLQIERQILGRAASFLGQQIRNFPVIDDYILSGGRGIATSIKTLDLTRTSYQTVANLTGRLNAYARSLQGFTGATRQGVTIGAGGNPITDRVLVIAFEEGAASAQQATALA
ncbi:MAG: RHS repeat-associated core domain-containing protein [Pirellula sp.]